MGYAIDENQYSMCLAWMMNSSFWYLIEVLCVNGEVTWEGLDPMTSKLVLQCINCSTIRAFGINFLGAETDVNEWAQCKFSIQYESLYSNCFTSYRIFSFYTYFMIWKFGTAVSYQQFLIKITQLKYPVWDVVRVRM